MSTTIDNQFLKFECPHCHKKLSETIGRLKYRSYSCPGCGQAFDAAGFARATEKMQQSLEKISRKSTLNTGVKFRK